MALTRIGNQAITLDAAEIPNLDAAKITTGTLANARIAEASVTQHVTATDLQPIKSDISALALREATNESSAAFNLPNQFIDTFTDDTNLGTQTDCNRDSGYMKTETTSTTTATDGSTTFVDASGTVTGSITSTGTTWEDTVGGTLGGSCGLWFGGDRSNSYINLPNNNTFPFQMGSGDWTIEMFVYNLTSSTHDCLYGTTNAGTSMAQIATNNTDSIYWWGSSNSSSWDLGNGNQIKASIANGAWKHIAVVRNGAYFDSYYDGTRVANDSIFSSTSFVDDNADLRIGANVNVGGAYKGYIDQLRVSNVSRYSGGSLTVPSGSNGYTLDANTKLVVGSKYSSTTTNATGTLIQSANAVGSAKTKVGGTMLYKDNAGTATLGTDLKIYFTCDGGSNWTEATSYSAITPVYSTGIKQVRLGETTCTSGTDVRYKAVWANQAASSKETQLHGIGVNY